MECTRWRGMCCGLPGTVRWNDSYIRREALVWKVLRGLITFGLVTLAWIFFRAESTRAALGLISRIDQPVYA